MEARYAKAVEGARLAVEGTTGVDATKARIFRIFLVASVAIGIVMLVALLISVLVDGWPRLNADLLNDISPQPEKSGIWQAIVGTFWLMIGVAVIVLPLAVAAAIYLEEYANSDRWYNRMIEINIQNLAAVPSIVFGILGLGFITRAGLEIGGTSIGLDLGPILLAGSLTLALMVLPTVILASREAIRAVPDTIREASYGLGATKWQTIWNQVLPASIPGISTGMILALSRAIGETAPLVLFAATFITFTPQADDLYFGSEFTAIPIQIFNFIRQPQEEFQVLAAAAAVVLLVMLLAMNSIAIYIRHHFRKRVEQN